VQMTLHAMLRNSAPASIHFVFPAGAIWRGPIDARPFPAPMALLSDWFARSGNDAQSYEWIVVPFLEKVITEYPIAGYPAGPPMPALKELLHGWNIVVRFGNRFERTYRRAESNKRILLEFQ